MTRVLVPPSQVDSATDLIQLIGMGSPGRVLAVREAGWSHGWTCLLWEIYVEGAHDVLRQPERKPVEVWR